MRTSAIILQMAVSAAVVLATSPPAVAGSAAFEAAFQRVYAAPNDPSLNMAFAREAEAEGELRLAFAALERAVRAAPGDPEIQREYARLRALLLPGKRVINYDIGLAFASNPRLRSKAPDTVIDPEDPTIPVISGALPRRASMLYEAGVSVADERTLASTRWKTIALARGHYAASTSELTNGQVAGWTGPNVQIDPETQLHIAFGGGGQWNDGGRSRYDASTKLQLVRPMGGLPQIFELQMGYLWGRPEGKLRDSAALRIDDDDLLPESRLRSTSGFYINASATFTRDVGHIQGDKLYLQPVFNYFRPKPIESIVPDFTESELTPGSTLSFRPDSLTIGGRISYAFPLREDRVIAGVSFGLFQSWILDGPPPLPVSIPPDFPRKSLRIEPAAALIFPNLVARDVDFRIDYRFEKSFSDRAIGDYDNHVVGARITGRF